jgi:hypothetical protein
MHLMYTINENGSRIYTLKVRFLALILTTFRLMEDNIESDRYWENHEIGTSWCVCNAILPILGYR